MSQAGLASDSSSAIGDVTQFTVQTGTSPVTPLAGNVNFNGAAVAAGTNPVRTDGTGAHTMALEVQLTQAIGATDATKVGLAAFNSGDFVVDANGFVQLVPFGVDMTYTNVTHAMSPYTVLATDEYISCDTSGGTITLNFPNAPTFKQEWTVKDRTGNAAASNITLTTPGGIVTFDGATSVTIVSNFGVLSLKANATPTYELF